MKRFIILLLALIGVKTFAQFTTIAIQDFDTIQTPGWNYVLSSGNLQFVNGNSAFYALPANSPFGINGSWAWKQEQQSSGVMITFDNINITGLDTAYITFRLAAFALNGSDGMETADYVTTAVSVNNGTTWYDQIKVTGNGNSSWPFTAPAIASRVFSTSAVTVFAPTAGDPAPDGFSTVMIKVPNTTNQVRVRITLRSSSANERWCVDNVALLKRVNNVNDIGVVSIDSPVSFCPGTHTIIAKIKNFGKNQVTSASVKWALNGSLQTPVSWTGVLDTLGGSGSNTAQVLLGSYNFIPNSVTNIKAWTSSPNNVADTMNMNDTVTAVLRPALSGTYTIGGTSPDFTTFTAAANALNLAGVCGPVVFNVAPGSYNEQVMLQMEGSSAVNTVTFQSATGDSTSVILYKAATGKDDNYIVLLNGADYVTFRKMTLKSTATVDYTQVVVIINGAHNNRIENNVIEAPVATSAFYSTSTAVVHNNLNSRDTGNVILNNRILNGSYGICWHGYGYVSPNPYESHNRIEGNIIEGYYAYGIQFYYQDTLQVIDNTIIHGSAPSTNYGIYAYYLNNGCAIKGNTISLTGTLTLNGISIYSSMYGLDVLQNKINLNSTSTINGILLNDVDYRLNVSKNIIITNTTSTSYTLYLINCDGIAGQPIRVTNNMLSHVGGTTNTVYGLYLSGDSYLDVYYNSVSLNGGSASAGRALYQTGGSNQNFKNNIFTNTGGGYSYYINTNNAVLSSDYNDLYTTGTILANWNAANRNTLFDLQTASSMDSHSLSVNPGFVSTTDLHINTPAVDEKGIPVAGITDDIDGHLRDAVTPDIGADEISFYANDAGISSFLFPSDTICSGIKTVSVILKNFGPSILNSVMINWKVNGINQAIYNWTGNILPMGTANVNIGTYNFQFGTSYNIMVATSNPNNGTDSVPGNDTLWKYNIFVKPTPVATPTSASYSICQGDSVFVGGTLSGTLPWNMIISDGTNTFPFNNITSPVFGIYVSPAITTTYSVISLTDSTGCVNTSMPPIIVTVNPLPVVGLGADTIICHNAVVILDAGAGFSSYLWSNGDTSQSVMVDLPGFGIGSHTIWVKVIDSYGCENIDTVQVTIVYCVEIPETDNNIDMVIYPNPNNGSFELILKGMTGNLNVILYDTKGKTIMNEKLKVNSQGTYVKSFDFDTLPKGVYFIRIFNNCMTRNERIIIQ